MMIHELRKLYIHQKLSPEQVVEDIIFCAERDAELNIWITPPSHDLIKPYIERLASLDREQSPLWGIPFAIKDNIDLAGVPTTTGCPEYAYIPHEHAIVVQRLIDAGAIPVGKANLDQFATGLVGTRSPYGETHNALREELISGGSSSGSAVAVGRGQVAFALGTDTAGSGRVPAALNNLVGFKPSVGAWPTKGVVPACRSLDCLAVFAHTVEDTLQVDEVVRGTHHDDAWSRDITRQPSKLPHKICLPKGDLVFFGAFAEGYSKAWQHALDKIKKLGIPIEYVDDELFAQAAEILYEGPWVAERWADLGAFIEQHPGRVFPVTEQVLRSGADGNYSAATLFQAMHRLQSLKLKASHLLKDAVLVMPTAGGTWSREEVRADPVGTNREMGRYTNHCNLLDLCALAVPAGEVEHNTPFGITLFSLAEQEDLICGLADSLHNQSTGSTLLAVGGLHMRGYPLERQMHDCAAHFVREDMTAEKYELFKLATVPAKPGLVKKLVGGTSIHVEIWEMPLAMFGSFVASIPSPLGIGMIELKDGSEVPGFICESHAVSTAENISHFTGWRQMERAQQNDE